MGFRNKTWLFLYTVFICFLSLRVNVQNIQSVDLDNIYNEWALSISESTDDVLVYRDEDDFIFDDVFYNEGLNLKFTTYDNLFYLKYFGRRKFVRRCGNDTRNYLNRKSKWRKGVWKLIDSGQMQVLELNYLEAEKGKSYRLESKKIYQIIYLEEDKMILRKLENDI